MTVQIAWTGQELALALKQTPAPDQEFIRTPAKYIFKKLADTAGQSGDLALSSFRIDNELTGSGDVRVSINLANMDLFEAIQAVAKAAGAGVEFQTSHVVLKDPSGVEPFVLKEKPAAEPIHEAPASDNESKKQAEEELPGISFSDVSHALVFVENGNGRGSGFIGKMDGATYVFSNQHNFLGAKRIRLRAMNGNSLKPNSFEYSRTHDLVRMRLEPEDIEGLSTLKLSFDIPLIHDEILIYGNSAGGGVATELEGEILGVGPADIEITAKMVPGNSGSPILNNRAEVVGVATYATLGREFEKGSAYEKMFKGTRFSKVRRYGIRIPEKGWINDSMGAYLRQTYLLEDMKTYLIATYALQQYWIGNSDYNGLVSRMFSSYASISHKGDPPFEFKKKEMEEQLKRVVRSFKMTHEDFQGTNYKTFSSSQEDGATRIKRLLSDGVKDVVNSVDGMYWKSNLLKIEARMIKEMADEIINQIGNTKNPYSSGHKQRRI